MVIHVKVIYKSSEINYLSFDFLIDINECNDSTICGNGVCINTIGSYTCNCSTGYKFDGQTCIG